MNRLAAYVRTPRSSLTITLLLVTIALTVAVLSDATLLYDGSYFLFQAVNAQEIQIPQLRVTFGLLQWPAVLATHVTDSFTILRILYSIPIVAAPLIGMALSWWVVKPERPHLIIWPALGILLIDLPGQMHWIATSIRTNQLFWPILLAVFIGMPDRVIPVVFMLLVATLLLHPQVSAFLLAAMLAALYIAWRQPHIRKRLLSAALCFGFGAIYRAGVIEIGYESGEMSFDNQQRQWESAVSGLPAWALLAVGVAALAIFAAPRLPRGRRWFSLLAALMLSLCGILFLIWAGDPGQWKSAIDYRGPSLVLSLLLMGLAFLDATIRLPQADRLVSAARVRTGLTHVASLVFCLTIIVQCVTWNGELGHIRTAIAESDTACVRQSTIAGMESNPANFWSLPAMSIMLQDTQPDHVILPDHLCETAARSGGSPMALFEPDVVAESNNIDILHLGWSVAADGGCWMRLTSGWHELERSGETWWRWSPDAGEVRVLVGESGTAMITGMISSLPQPNRVSITVNGETQHVVELQNDEWKPMDGLALELQAGENIIRFVSEQPAEQALPDTRELALSVMNLNLTVPSLRTQCTIQ